LAKIFDLKNLMEDLNRQIKDRNGKILIVGLGSAERGDDGVGLYIAKRLASERLPENVEVVLCESEMDLLRLVGTLSVNKDGSADGLPCHVIFLDAVEFGGREGEIAFLGSEEIKSRFPQVSTHKISLSAIAKYIEANGKTSVWLIGIQVKNIRMPSGLSPEVKEAADVLTGLLTRQPGMIIERLSGVGIIKYV
jgi:hydrogenase 3 maturation protease